MGFSDITHLNHIACLLEGKFMRTRHRIMNVSGGKLFSSCFDSIFSEPGARTPTYLHAGTGAKKTHTHSRNYPCKWREHGSLLWCKRRWPVAIGRPHRCNAHMCAWLMNAIQMSSMLTPCLRTCGCVNILTPSHVKNCFIQATLSHNPPTPARSLACTLRGHTEHAAVVV